MPTSPLRRSPEERERLSERIADRLDAPFTALGIIFVLLVLAETLVRPQAALSTAFAIAGWAIWALFAIEFAVRMAVAPSTARFLRRNWWQLVFLALPFLRFLRVIARLRLRALVRGGRVLSSAVRGTRTAGRTLTGRLGWLSAVTAIVILASSQLLYEFGGYDSYAAALHNAAFTTIAAQPLEVEHWLPDVLEIALSAYSVVVFAALAGMLGAFFLEKRSEARAGDEAAGLADADGADVGPVRS